MANDQRYRLSFTTGGLFIAETPSIVEIYLDLGDWKKVRDMVREKNLLQVRTSTASLRISKEVVARLEFLTQEELEELVYLNFRDLGYLLWVAVCRRYSFIRDFATEVVREHYLVLRRHLPLSDFDAFLNSKSLWHEELDSIAPSTSKKLRQNLFRMLREANLVDDNLHIQAAMVSPRLAQVLSRNDISDLQVFPATDNDIQRWLA
ncbi:DUF1819 family protein [Undibacterium sp. LX40W]|uniref:DUF1819 family protein n=1 Tax=Undibacterium nitidum TaxID=2762298 RepID=A0A923HM44_9BURK|nr:MULTISPECIES: DUF1819 family protein [Undibacterium]MBC3881562.1 DUF1819 family protein [Undibacterium nitidum]MBC3891656.1 DUF1819 family protein [Undibacterium sp. LX40W]